MDNSKNHLQIQKLAKQFIGRFNISGLWVKIVTTLLALALFFKIFAPYRVVDHIGNMNVLLCVVPFFTTFVAVYVLRSIFWLLYFRFRNIKIRLDIVVAIISASVFSTLFIPARFAEPISAYLFNRCTNEPIALLVSYAFFERILNLILSIAVFVIISTFLSVFLPDLAFLPDLLIQVVTLLKGINFFWPFIICVIIVLSCVLMITHVKSIRQSLWNVMKDMKQMLIDPKFLFSAFGMEVLCILILGVQTLVLICVFPSTDFAFSLYSYLMALFVMTASTAIGAISIFPTGVGLGEFGFAGLLVLIGIPAEIASAIVLLNIAIVWITIILVYVATNVIWKPKGMPNLSDKLKTTIT